MTLVTAPPQPVGRQVDPTWWAEASVDGRPMPEVLAARDIGAVFRFLRSKGWSLTATCAATGLKEVRIRAVMRGLQRITSYEVLERVALGLHIPRGSMGLGQTEPLGGMLARVRRCGGYWPRSPETGATHGLHLIVPVALINELGRAVDPNWSDMSDPGTRP